MYWTGRNIIGASKPELAKNLSNPHPVLLIWTDAFHQLGYWGRFVMMAKSAEKPVS